MANGPTKHWLTPKRIARGLEAAERELKRWHMSPEEARRFWREHAGDFRTVAVEGDARSLRADALADKAVRVAGKEDLTAADIARIQKRERETGASFMHRDPFYEPLLTPRFILFSVAALGGGYLIGRWWKRRTSSARTHVADAPSSEVSPYLSSLALANI